MGWIERLLAIDTTSSKSNLALVEEVEREAERLGLPATRVSHGVEPKANLWVTVPAGDGGREGGVVLSGHTDTVPVDGQDWSSEPFRPSVRDGRLYARGAADMKSFIGVAVSSLSQFAAAELREPLHLALSYDEEVGCKGAVDLVDAMTSAGERPRVCIVGEPTGMRVVTGHKSISLVELVFHGVAVHSSLTTAGVNAIEYAAQVVDFVRRVGERFRAEGPFDDAFPLPHSTASVNLVTGGIAANTVPDRCSVTFEIRTIASEPPEQIVSSIERYVRELEVDMRTRSCLASVEFIERASVPALDVAGDSPAARLCEELGGIASTERVTFATEAGMFERAGIPSVVCGPGEISDAHRADESIELEQISECEQLLARLLAHLSGG